MAGSFWIETLGCPKNQVDSDKLVGTMLADGLVPAESPEGADVVVVNTCAFVEEARQESIDTILNLDGARAPGARLVVTGCMAERYGDELAEALPEVDSVAGFGVPVTLGAKPSKVGDEPLLMPSLDLLNLPRPASSSPWAYVKVAEGCDRACGFCAIPSFRGKQRSRTVGDILDEVDALQAKEIVLVAQDLAAFGRDQGVGERAIVPLVEAVAERMAAIRRREPGAAFRSNFIVGYPGETEADHDQLLAFVEEARLDWCGFFAFSKEDGTYAADLDGEVPEGLMHERLAELRELQDRITAARRDELIGSVVEVLVDAPGQGRTYREAPEIDGIVTVPDDLAVGEFVEVRVVDALGPDLVAEVLTAAPTGAAS
jgi:tRNA A37 methylthiotransferase MiaB